MKLLRKTKSRLMNKLGFTLIELLLVLLVLSILAAVVLPEVVRYYDLHWAW
jgi:prepilin-type N-terminal cleavage/methylation domain-containing protein